MYSRPALFLATLVCLCLLCTQTRAEYLRGKRQLAAAHESMASSVFRITVLDELTRMEDGTMAEVETLLAIPIHEDGTESSEFLSIDLPTEVLAHHHEAVRRGRLIVSVPGATHHDGDAVVMPPHAVVTATSHPRHAERRRRRHLQSRTGDVRRVAVLRVSVAEGPHRHVSYTAERIRQQIFDGPLSLVEQIRACSTGSLTIDPAGVYEVTVPGVFADYPAPAHVRNRALTVFAQQLGVASAREMFDHVMVILPPNEAPGFVGNAGVDHWVSTLNDVWGLDIMVYMVRVTTLKVEHSCCVVYTTGHLIVPFCLI